MRKPIFILVTFKLPAMLQGLHEDSFGSHFGSCIIVRIFSLVNYYLFEKISNCVKFEACDSQNSCPQGCTQNTLEDGVYYSDQQFVYQQTAKLFFKNSKRNVFRILEHLPLTISI